jgi:hypothetical protein
MAIGIVACNKAAVYFGEKSGNTSFHIIVKDVE